MKILQVLQLLKMYWPVFPLVFLAGLIDAIAGGGGLISLPAYMIAGLPPHQAIATNKMSSSLGTALSTIRFAISGYIHLQTALFAVPCALAGSWAGSSLNLMISNDVFKTAVIVLRKKDFEDGKEPCGMKKTIVLSCLIALGIGVYDGFYGPGTGTFLILLLTGLAHMSLQDANGLTKAINISTNLPSLTVYLLLGQVLIPLGLLAGICGIAGNYLGVSFFDSRGSKIVRPVMLSVLVIFMCRTIYDLLSA